jgi:hypothetical protein
MMSHLNYVPRISTFLLMISLCGSPVSDAYAAAFCALRDPTDAILAFFPEHSSSRSIVKLVSPEIKITFAEQLPFGFHHKEFGKHTLYMAFKDETPLGMIQARSEKGQWGINEIIWAMDMDYRIIGFKFQRCRCTAQDEVESEQFQALLIGQNWQQLKEKYIGWEKSGENILPHFSPAAQKLALSVFRSAIKASISGVLFIDEPNNQ